MSNAITVSMPIRSLENKYRILNDLCSHTESEEIIETLKRLDPDIAIVQEIDIYCQRSGNADHMKNICMALGWKGGFVAEFLELESPIRRVQDQVCSPGSWV
jgi:hypothetical protein